VANIRRRGKRTRYSLYKKGCVAREEILIARLLKNTMNCAWNMPLLHTWILVSISNRCIEVLAYPAGAE
jgi:hypothetical protein